ncbi:hypothetical protein ABH15_11390 [Methanoculleus taiwanensis]|uniref:Uncharacterized protein n=1 Tax=Methanoculleus taiwanensis TaxID=1550565 RepID=A0A498GXX4_9EURY|nr:hypothetical protein [Methanoculleus taiwanensis]RXE55353.1 hypothetical protein ABH15_11390 [Methanoculleus taiwanensis]
MDGSLRATGMHLLLATLIIAGVAVPPASGQRIVSDDGAASLSIPPGGMVKGDGTTAGSATRLDALSRPEVLATAALALLFWVRRRR